MKSVKNYILKLLNAVTNEEFGKYKETVASDNKKSINMILEWRRGMHMLGKDVDGIEKAARQIESVVRELPIYK